MRAMPLPDVNDTGPQKLIGCLERLSTELMLLDQLGCYIAAAHLSQACESLSAAADQSV